MKKYLILSLLLVMACSSSAKKNGGDETTSVTPQVEEKNTEAAVEQENVPSEEVKKIQETTVSDTAYKNLAKAIQAKNETRVVDEASKILSQHPNDLKALNSLAVFYLEVGKLDLAKMILGRASKANPSSAPLATNLGLVYLAQHKQSEAIAEFQRALTLDPNNISANYNLGVIYEKYQNFGAAAPLLEKSYLSLGQKSLVAAHYAAALRGIGKFNEAAEVYSNMKADESGNVSVLMNYATLLVDDLKNKKLGLKVINKIRFISQDPDILKRVQGLTDRAQAIK